MIQLLGLHKDCSISIREKLSIIPKRTLESLKNLQNICEEVVIISTCNRTEIYFNVATDSKQIVEDIFKVLKWDVSLIKYTYHIKEMEALQHLMEVVCGFDSKILGEDQILGQVKSSYEEALRIKSINKDLQRLFQAAITCGKEFKVKSKLYKIPVSASSIAVKESINRGIKKFMILGFGDVGQLVSKYILGSEFELIYIAVRDINSVVHEDDRIKVIPFGDRKKYYNDVECIISCTSAPHCVIEKVDLPDRKLLIFDLAVPRDVHIDVCTMDKVKVFDIDMIDEIDDNNRRIREEMMESSRYIILKHVESFISWQKMKVITPYIKKLKNIGEKIYMERYTAFKNKRQTKDNEALAGVLLKSTSDAYINRAIEVLKDAQLNGRAEECLRIIEKIFYPQT